MKKKIDYSLYFVADRDFCKSFSIAETVEKAIEGGVTIVQYRAKNASGRELLLEALSIKEICRRKGALFIVNDRVDIALACGADGVHLGQKDIPADVARTILGDEAVIGVSAATGELIEKAFSDGADYVGSGPLYPTDSKRDTNAVLGLDNLQRLTALSKLPVVAIGGINPERAREALQCGASGVAVISYISFSEDPAQAAAQFFK